MKKETSKGKTKTTAKKGLKKELTKAEIIKKMRDPNLTTEERNRLDNLLWKDIPVIKSKNKVGD